MNFFAIGTAILLLVHFAPANYFSRTIVPRLVAILDPPVHSKSIRVRIIFFTNGFAPAVIVFRLPYQMQSINCRGHVNPMGYLMLVHSWVIFTGLGILCNSDIGLRLCGCVLFSYRPASIHSRACLFA